MNRRMPNGTYGGVRGGGREAPAYSIQLFHFLSSICCSRSVCCFYTPPFSKAIFFVTLCQEIPVSLSPKGS